MFLPETLLESAQSEPAGCCVAEDRRRIATIAERTEIVLGKAEALVRQSAASADQERLLQAALSGLRIQMVEDPAMIFPCIHLAPLTYAGIRGEEPSVALDLGAITALVFIGLDTIDDLADGDRPPHWQDWGAAEINLAAATLLSAIVPKAISELAVGPGTRDDLQRLLAEALLRMSAGQLSDLANANRGVITAGEIERSVAGKSGEEFAVFAALGAQLAGAPPDLLRLYADAAHGIGVAGQLASDCFDLFNDPAARDLAHGSRTLPIVLHLERLSGEDQSRFLDLLDRARDDERAREKVRAEVRPRVIRHCAFVVELHCQRARRAIEQAAPYEPARSDLFRMAAQMSFFESKSKERKPNE